MQIHQRINARKLVLSYLYHYCFFVKLASSLEVVQEHSDTFSSQGGNDPFFDQNFLADLQKLRKADAEEKKKADRTIASALTEAAEDEMPYYLKHFFDQRTEADIDVDYVFKIWAAFPNYCDEVEKAVNTYTESFSYQQMDIMDQAIFLLGYTEWKILQTPKEILINEMIELAKRYSDEGAPKLINGIMDNITNPARNAKK